MQNLVPGLPQLNHNKNLPYATFLPGIRTRRCFDHDCLPRRRAVIQLLEELQNESPKKF